MTISGPDDAPRTRRALSRPKLAIWLVVGLGVVGVAVANAHLVYVAFKSHPACVAHDKERGDLNGKGAFRAARSAC